MTFPAYSVHSAFELDWNLCFARSRRLTGMNRFFDGPAAILETRGPLARDADSIHRWAQLAGTLVRELFQDEPALCGHVFGTGAELVIRCPFDQQFTATEINEYAWEVVALGENSDARVGEFDRLHRFRDVAEARGYFRQIAAAEHEQLLRQLLKECNERRLPYCLDDESLSLGAGQISTTFPLSHLPAPEAVDWSVLGRIPVVLVTGSNGKTTTTRLIAAMLDQSGDAMKDRVGFCGTEGIVIGSEWIQRGDYSGPAGARLVLRDARVSAAVLETARGGILRRGLAVNSADVAVVTNISADHFGEYGIDTLDDIAEAKLAVAHPLGPEGTLVINADDSVLMHHVARLRCKLALFSLSPDSSVLVQHLDRGGLACVTREGELVLEQKGWRKSLGPVADMPLAVGGAADYNIANIAAAALAAHVLDVPIESVKAVARQFGSHRHDNPGRFERWVMGGFTIVMDYAHNPDGLARLLRVCKSLKGQEGRMLLLLGQAGNREDADIRELARVAASSHPSRILVKELPGLLRGRSLGEVPAMLVSALKEACIADSQILLEPDEFVAATKLVGEARPGDVVVLPVHQKEVRDRLIEWIDALKGK